MVNVFSFCLYGPKTDRYYTGMQENVRLASRYYPDWKVYVYVGTDVTPEMLQWLREAPSVVLRETGHLGAQNMIDRFYAIDEPGVDLMLVRDADSRIHWKDRWAIQEFIDTPRFVAHTIRDNIEHTARLMGGLWGIRKSAGLHIRSAYASYVEDETLGHRHAHDQNFLLDVIYPKVRDRLLVHYSHDRKFAGEYAIPFPFEWSSDCFCGKIESGHTETPPPPRSVGLQLPRVLTRIR